VSKFVWIFVSASGRFPSAVYSDRESACRWIAYMKLTGVLTKYPIDISVYDWAIEKEIFEPKREEHFSARFIGNFTSAGMEHFHFEDGVVG